MDCGSRAAALRQPALLAKSPVDSLPCLVAPPTRQRLGISELGRLRRQQGWLGKAAAGLHAVHVTSPEATLVLFGAMLAGVLLFQLRQHSQQAFGHIMPA